MTHPMHLEMWSGAATEASHAEIAGATLTPVQRDPAAVIQHLTQQLDEVRKLNKRLELMNSELLAEKSNLRYRIVDEACDILKRRPIVQRASRFILPLARRLRWAFGRKATR